MELLHTFLDFILHLDQHMVTLFAAYGTWTYALLFLIIFCETGLVVTPFLPGDSLLFATGALAANSENTLNIHLLFLLLVSASILGNSLNYFIGRFLGPKVFHSRDSFLLNKKYLERAHQFYETYGGKAIIIARFMPIIRTFAPFIAGIGYMSYRRFFAYNIIGAVLWIGSLLYTSYFFGNLPFIKAHFSTIIFGIIGVSLLPAVMEILRHKVLAPGR
jgi:membrane-associated protein